MRHVFALLLAACALWLAACDEPYWATWRDCRPWDGPKWTYIPEDPDHCGGCGIRCGEGVPCVDFECQWNSVMHCGEADRQCIAVDDDEVACVQLSDGDAAPPGVEVVNGYGCVPSGRAGGAGIAEDGAGVSDGGPDDVGMPGRAKRLDPTWVLIPGYTPECLDGFDTNGCATGEVTLTDLCGASITEPFAYDFSIMTEEMSRAQYRALTCDCAAPRFARCRTLCAERDAPDAAERDEQPMTGLNWCEAYTACQALDARLPTVRERARLKAVVGPPVELFDESLICGAWAEATGGVPWLMECLEAAPDELGFDSVKGGAGRVYVGEGILSKPEPVRHLLGNVAEWAADPASALVTTVSGEEAPFWGPPRDEAEAQQPRLLRGRSLFSPAGERGDRLVAVDPSLRSEDIGVRCARTLRTPYDEPVPYDDGLSADDYARCDLERVALRPVRRTVGEQVFRATRICLDHEVPGDARRRFERLGESLLLDTESPSTFARLVNAGVLESVGLARFAGDEQWWWSEPVDEPDQKLAFRSNDEVPLWMTWHGESRPEQSRCIEGVASSLTDGKVIRRHTFTLEYDQSVELGLRGPEIACAHLDCIDLSIGDEECAAECPGWLLPFAVEFERVESSSSRDLCP